MANKIIVAHPGKQHVFQLITALKEEGTLYKFITMVYDKDNSITGRLKKFLKGNNQKKAASRRLEVLDDNDVILLGESKGLFLIFLNKLGVGKKVSSYFYDRVQSQFAMRVAKYAVAHKADVLVMFDSNVHGAFDYVKKHSPATKCVLDVTIASRPVMKDIYIKDMAVTGGTELKTEQIYLWDDARLESYKKEFIISDYMLVGSEFVKKSIEYLTGPSERIVKIPYGVNISQFNISEKDYLNGPLRLFFVGGVNRRKGVHHLLNTVAGYSKDQVLLSLAGGYDPVSDLYQNFKDRENIIFEGFVTRDVVADHYARSHIFVLPSLAEGLALVGLEALASGLPVLCTLNTGVNDLIVDGENGFVVPASNPQVFKEKIDWFLQNRDKVKRMSSVARDSVENYSWVEYHKKIKDFFNNI